MRSSLLFAIQKSTARLAFLRSSPRAKTGFIAGGLVIALVAWIVGGWTIWMGESGLWDPWETHYGEVARNIRLRDDPMDLRWKPGYGPDAKAENLFRSKHVLPFWGMALGMRILDVGTRPENDEFFRSSAVLWALRGPSMLLALCAVWNLARAVGRVAGWLSAWACAAVLFTMPQFSMVARQATTDIYFIAPFIIALAAWIDATLGPETPLRQKTLRWSKWKLRVPWDSDYFRFCGWYLVVVAVPLALLLYHVGRERTFEIVGNWPKRDTLPTVEDLRHILIVLQCYAVVAGLMLLRCLWAPTRRDLARYMMYLMAGWALMGKGLLGPALLAGIFAMDIVSRWDLRELLRARLPTGLVLFFLACAPWHHAMAIFRGEGWINELWVVNNLERFFTGEQAQAVGEVSYYLGVLSIAMGVWVLFLPSALARVFTQVASRRDPGVTALRRFATLAFLVCWTVISASVTKYMHYATVCLPPLAIVVALWWTDSWQSSGGAFVTGSEGTRGYFAKLSPERSVRESKKNNIGGSPPIFVTVISCLFLVAIAGTLIRYIVAEPAVFVHLTTYLYTGSWRLGSGKTEGFALLLGLAALGGVMLAGASHLPWSRRFCRSGLLILMGSAWASHLFLFADYIPASSKSWSQQEALAVYFDGRGEHDEIASWWFYHRGETFYTKRKIWVMMRPNARELRSWVTQKSREKGDIWFTTSPKNHDRLQRHLPSDLRENLRLEYENPHQILLRLELDEKPDSQGIR